MKFLAFFFIFSHLSFVACAEETLKAKLFFDFFYQSCSKGDFVSNRIPLFEKYGLSVVEENPDVILVCGPKYIDKKVFAYKKPIIILDGMEAASLAPTLRKYLKNSLVKAIFKNTTLRPVDLYKYHQRYHFLLDKQNIDYKVVSKFEKQFFNKIKCVLWLQKRSGFANSLLSPKDTSVDFNLKRPIDVALVCTLKNGIKKPHRELAFASLAKIRNKKIVMSEGGIPYEEYVELHRNAKIVVSPWGTGEWCFRDYEAIYLGAVLIKPDTSFVQSCPDLYQNNVYYVPCKHDFSDLEEKINYVLKNYDQFTEMRKKAKRLLIDYWDDEKIAKDFVEAVKKALQS